MHEIHSKTQSKIINVIYTLHTSTIQCIHLKVNALTDVRRLFKKKNCENAWIKSVKTTKAFFLSNIWHNMCCTTEEERVYKGKPWRPKYRTSIFNLQGGQNPPPPQPPFRTHATTHKLLITRAHHSTSMQHIFILNWNYTGLVCMHFMWTGSRLYK